MSRRSGLGRGLGALIPNDLVSPGQEMFRELPLAAIEPNRFQPRAHFDEASLISLSESIRELGVLQPVLVRPMENDVFELIAGERRWRAARKAGLSSIPAIVRSVSDTVSLEQALVENLHRSDLSALEEAAAYQQLMEDFGLTQEQVAARVGKSRPAVANTLRLLQLPSSTQRLVAEGRLSPGHARALLATPDRNLQERLGRQIVEESWTVRQVEEALRPRPEPELPQPAAEASRPPAGSEPQPRQAGTPPAALRAPKSDEIAVDPAISLPMPAGERAPAGEPTAAVVLPAAGLLELEQLLGDFFDTNVRIAAGKGRGRLTIEFADLADLERIYRLIVNDQ